ncbi:hypothetical protein GQ43DRAFT_498411 [Delitschia confertaspora ATCC 74209]|uniref:Elongation factor 1 alpha-like protein n=1 Tax=Delitschia confertaspora ATCC 74209 TaxID=1513339 RepID=A0A9P4JCE5_9PLEO|nr:hypothetical protein GQ43DRAFT_498411 [Delitschia confertaspora ATCC 74209]
MPSHHRAKNVAYDDDDVYSDEDYVEQEEDAHMTEEDKEQMRLGTIQVKEALGSTVTVSDKEIEESLWHYYYDVDKAVVYLKNKHTPKTAQPKKQKTTPVSRFDQAASAVSTSKQSITVSQPLPSIAYPLPYDSFSATDFWKDTPWLNVPLHRLGVITMEPKFPRGGLLGGSSSNPKPSKLAALAAARKKKQEEAKSVPPLTEADPNQKADSDSAVALLDKLRLNGKDKTTPTTPIPAPISMKQKPVERKFPIRTRSPSPPPAAKVSSNEKEATKQELSQAPIPIPDLRAIPSTFASTLCGIAPSPPKRQLLEDSFQLPYSTVPQFANTNPFAGPSPDDIVRNAQAKGKPVKKDANKTLTGDKLADSVSKMTVDDTKVKSKNLNVVEEFEKSNTKRMANFVVVGHVDHGKSTLMGRLLYDLKVISDRSIAKLRKEAETIGKSSFALAWVMDQTDEERSRGVTVDIATNYFETEKTRFTILDAPGHKDFIPNMIAGASQADFAVLVIDASTNSFESGLKGQTKEHALLVRSMGVQRLIIAVNKMDTIAWSEDRYNEITQQMAAFLTSASFSPKYLTFIPCAGLTGENVTKPLEMQQAPWYTGPTLLGALDTVSATLASHPLTKPLRITISDVFRGGIQNPVSITGRLDSGTCQVGDTLIAMPANETAVIKAIELEDQPVDWAVAGQISTLHLAGIDAVHLRPGDIVSHPSDPVKLASSFTAKILAFEHVLPMNVDVFRGRLSGEGKVQKLVAVLDKSTGEVVKKKVRIVKPGEVARVTVGLERVLPIEAGMRVILREGGLTVASGIVETVEKEGK